MEIKISLLILLFAFEFLLIFMALTLILWRKHKKSAALGGFDYKGLEERLEEEINRLDSESRGLEGEEAARKLMVRDIYVLKLSLINSIGRGKLDEEALGQDVEKLVADVFGKMAVAPSDGGAGKSEADTEAPPATMPPPSPPPSPTAPPAPAVNYKKLIIELLSFKQMFDELQQEFIKLKAANSSYIDRIVDEATSSEPLQQLTMDMEKSGGQMDKRIGVLKKESSVVDEKIKNFEALFMQAGGAGACAGAGAGASAKAPAAAAPPAPAAPAAGPSFMETQAIAAPDIHSQERILELEAREKALTKAIEDLKKDSAKKEKALKTLQENYATLETEYINIYKEHKGESPG
jgi:hypothetical protein